MKEQLLKMGLSLDWEREIATCHPEYYKHEQKVFVDMFKAGLAYKKEAEVNWDPVDKTVLMSKYCGRFGDQGLLSKRKNYLNGF